jgi:hypothetical protein
MTFHQLQLLSKKPRIDFQGRGSQDPTPRRDREELARSLWNQNEAR